MVAIDTSDPTVDSFVSVFISEMPEVEIEIVFLHDSNFYVAHHNLK